MSVPGYPDYKYSGVQWLGAVPRDWAIVPFWSLFRRTKRVGFPDEELLSVYRDYGVIRKQDRDDNFNNASEDLGGYQLVEVGDLAMNKMKAWQGSVGISPHRGIVSPAYFVFSSRHSHYPAFLHYLLRSQEYAAGYMTISKGIRINQWDVDPDHLSSLPIPIPTLAEQRAIANFLDRETAKIDGLVAEQERLIALLKEKRQAVISHAVTKGLNPNAPMKDSGIEWLGQIPVHWGVRRISSISTKITNGFVGPTRDILVDDGVRYLQSLHIKKNQIRFDTPYFVRPEWSTEHSKSILDTGDVLIVQTGDIGQSAVVPQEFSGCNCHALIIVAPVHEIIRGPWLSWVLNSDYGFHSLLSIQTGALHPHLNCGNVKELHIPIPALDEQDEITSFIENHLTSFDDLIREAQSAITLLQERRAALISAAVTGKIDVRAAVSTPELETA